jgi:hypothetical protein
MMPQSPGNNRGIWKYTEELTRFYASKYGQVYVITGTINDATSKVIGNNVVVPAYVYKIVVDPARQRAITFLYPNVKLDPKTIEQYVVSIADVEKAMPVGATMGRPHLADALVAKKIVKSRDEAFIELLHNDSRFYVSHAAPTPVEAIALIRRAGGVAVIAHPFASHRGQILKPDDFADLVTAGLNGIEVDHRDQNPDERAMLRVIARELNLVVTGSSDYHGTGKLNSLAENHTSREEWQKLEAQADARRVVKA